MPWGPNFTTLLGVVHFDKKKGKLKPLLNHPVKQLKLERKKLPRQLFLFPKNATELFLKYGRLTA